MNVNVRLVKTADPILEAIADAEVVIIDCETSSLHPWRDGKILAGLGVKPLDGLAFYLPVRHRNGGKNAPIKELRRVLKALRKKTLVAHNAKFDVATLEQDER